MHNISNFSVIKFKPHIYLERKNYVRNGIFIMLSVLLMSSCATIISGSNPSISIDGNVTEPVTISTSYQTYENVNLPQVVKVKRKKLDGQRIQITSQNYTFKDIVLKKTINGWTFGNILLGGIIGWAVDLGTNAVSKPEQDNFFVNPIPKTKSEEPEKP